MNFLLNHQENIFKLKRCEIAKKIANRRRSLKYFLWAAQERSEREQEKILRGLKIVTLKQEWKNCYVMNKKYVKMMMKNLISDVWVIDESTLDLMFNQHLIIEWKLCKKNCDEKLIFLEWKNYVKKG